jgi:hypothetical protein
MEAIRPQTLRKAWKLGLQQGLTQIEIFPICNSQKL